MNTNQNESFWHIVPLNLVGHEVLAVWLIYYWTHLILPAFLMISNSQDYGKHLSLDLIRGGSIALGDPRIVEC